MKSVDIFIWRFVKWFAMFDPRDNNLLTRVSSARLLLFITLRDSQPTKVSTFFVLSENLGLPQGSGNLGALLSPIILVCMPEIVKDSSNSSYSAELFQGISLYSYLFSCFCQLFEVPCSE